MRFFGRSLLAVFLLALTLGVLALAGQTVVSALQARLAGGEGGAPAREREFTAAVVTATAGPVVPVMTAYGEVRSTRTLELRSPQPGTVIWLADGFADGAAVSAGEVLVRLDPADAAAARDLARSDLARAEAEVAEATRARDLARDELAAAQKQASLRAQALARQTDLAARGVGSAAAVETAALALAGEEQAVLARRQALSQAGNRVDLAATAVARQQITLAEAGRALAQTEIRAEFDGLLNAVTTVAGGVVGGNERLAELIDPASLEVSLRLSTAQFARLIDPAGQLVPAPIRVALDATGVVAQGRLVRVAAAVAAGQTGRLVYAALDQARGFRPGDFVTVRIDEPALEGVIVLPATALGPRGTVLVLAADDRLEELAVDLLRRQDDQVIVRAAGLAGREVVAERSPLLGAGIRIRPVRPEAAAGLAAPALVSLSPARRAALVALVEANAQMPAEAKARVLDQLAQERVPAPLIARLETRMGG
ncbi:MAG: HlyD family efflux transporter periplasmic adaptor subunit [Pseudorhodobacter sp.]|nr:HlyD family efflux transporter periplasmic adaptor subunit [Pseudorhodobacter sp.]